MANTIQVWALTTWPLTKIWKDNYHSFIRQRWKSVMDIRVVIATWSLSTLLAALFFVACSRLRDSRSAKLRKRGDLCLRVIPTIWDWNRLIFFGTRSFSPQLLKGACFSKRLPQCSRSLRKIDESISRYFGMKICG